MPLLSVRASAAILRLIQIAEIQSIPLLAVLVDQTATFTAPLHLCHRLREVHMNAAIVNQHIIHLDVRLLARFRILKLDKRILQRIVRHPIANHLAADHPTETTEYNLQIIVTRHRIQFAHKQHILGRRHVRIGQIADNLQDRRTRPCLTLLQHFGHLLAGLAVGVIDVLIGADATALQSRRRRRRRSTGRAEAARRLERIVQYDGVRNAHVLVRPMRIVADRRVQRAQHLNALRHLADDTVTAHVQRRQIGAQREEELRTDQAVIAGADHGQQAGVRVPNARLHIGPKVPFAGVGIEQAPHRAAAGAGAGWITGLRDEALLYGVEEIVVVVLEAAQFQEVQARVRTLVDEQIDGHIAGGGLDDHGHGFAAGRAEQLRWSAGLEYAAGTVLIETR